MRTLDKGYSSQVFGQLWENDLVVVNLYVREDPLNPKLWNMC